MRAAVFRIALRAIIAVERAWLARALRPRARADAARDVVVVVMVDPFARDGARARRAEARRILRQEGPN